MPCNIISPEKNQQTALHKTLTFLLMSVRPAVTSEWNPTGLFSQGYSCHFQHRGNSYSWQFNPALPPAPPPPPPKGPLPMSV